MPAVRRLVADRESWRRTAGVGREQDRVGVEVGSGHAGKQLPPPGEESDVRALRRPARRHRSSAHGHRGTREIQYSVSGVASVPNLALGR